jgi:hypothetical protein
MISFFNKYRATSAKSWNDRVIYRLRLYGEVCIGMAVNTRKQSYYQTPSQRIIKIEAITIIGTSLSWTNIERISSVKSWSKCTKLWAPVLTQGLEPRCTSFTSRNLTNWAKFFTMIIIIFLKYSFCFKILVIMAFQI